MRRKPLELLIIVTLLGIFVGTASGQNAIYRESDRYDGHMWMGMQEVYKEVVVWGFVMGIRAYDHDLTTNWSIDAYDLVRRWDEPRHTFIQHVEKVNRFYRETRRLDVPIWIVLYTLGDEEWVNEY